ncbi:MAG: glycolate oxidase subunit GlcE [Gemmatimonadota bacterium]
MADAIALLQERVRAAGAAKTPLAIRAGGTKDFYGNAVKGEPLDPRAHAGIVAHEPTELVITARCGTPLAELEAALDEKGQMLAFEPPHFGAAATVGGCVAAGLSGPRRASVGSARDFVLGVKLIDGRGDLLRFGGTVMKNVAGYDVSRLLAGSLGTLGVIVEASLKVLPKPPAEATLRFELDEATAIRRMNEWAGQPLPISATAWSSGALAVRLSGARAAVDAARTKLGGERVDDAQAQSFWRGIREHTDPFFVVNAPLWRLGVPSTAEPLAAAGEQMIEWGGAQRWLRTSLPAHEVRKRAQSLGGHATLFRGGDRSVGVFAALAPAVAAIHKRLKAEFDPAGIFNPGRMYSDF